MLSWNTFCFQLSSSPVIQSLTDKGGNNTTFSNQNPPQVLAQNYLGQLAGNQSYFTLNFLQKKQRKNI